MAATQTNLNQFFKPKKSARAAHTIKNAKQTVVTDSATVPRLSVEEKESADETPPVTPKRKNENDEESKRKRRREAVEQSDILRTPEAPRSRDPQVPQAAPRSAKKRLIMEAGSRGLQGKKGTSGTDSLLASSPSKLLKGSPKLTPEEVKEQLGRCGRLDELRAKLLKVNQCGEKLKQFRDSTVAGQPSPAQPSSPSKGGAGSIHLERFSSLKVNVPHSPQKTPVKTPIKSPMKAPAYERFQHLVDKPSEELVLPFRYRLVKEVFRAVDTVVSILHNRQEVITYSKLKPAVQQMLSRTFQEQCLGQIKTVFPLAYFFKQEPSKGLSVTGPGSQNSHQLTLTANLDYKTSCAQNLSKMFDSPSVAHAPKYRKMDSVVMVERRNIFHNLLIDRLRDCHDQFLQTLDPPITSAGLSIKRWHPAFPLEEVPEVEAAPLPQPPQVDKLETARDVLEKAQDLLCVNPRMERAVAEAAAKTPTKGEQAPPPPAPETMPQPPTVCAALKGVSSSLLEKIRAREAAKKAREMTRSSSENKELEMLSRLPEIARIIRNSFVTEKKAALPWEVVAAKVTASYTSMLGGREVDSHLQLLIKEVPGWCTVHKVRSGVFLKIDKARELSSVTEQLEAAVKKLR